MIDQASKGRFGELPGRICAQGMLSALVVFGLSGCALVDAMMGKASGDDGNSDSAFEVPDSAQPRDTGDAGRLRDLSMQEDAPDFTLPSDFGRDAADVNRPPQDMRSGDVRGVEDARMAVDVDEGERDTNSPTNCQPGQQAWVDPSGARRCLVPCSEPGECNAIRGEECAFVPVAEGSLTGLCLTSDLLDSTQGAGQSVDCFPKTFDWGRCDTDGALPAVATSDGALVLACSDPSRFSGGGQFLRSVTVQSDGTLRDIVRDPQDSVISQPTPERIVVQQVTPVGGQTNRVFVAGYRVDAEASRAPCNDYSQVKYFAATFDSSPSTWSTELRAPATDSNPSLTAVTCSSGYPAGLISIADQGSANDPSALVSYAYFARVIGNGSPRLVLTHQAALVPTPGSPVTKQIMADNERPLLGGTVLPRQSTGGVGGIHFSYTEPDHFYFHSLDTNGQNTLTVGTRKREPWINVHNACPNPIQTTSSGLILRTSGLGQKLPSVTLDDRGLFAFSDKVKANRPDRVIVVALRPAGDAFQWCLGIEDSSLHLRPVDILQIGNDTFAVLSNGYSKPLDQHANFESEAPSAWRIDWFEVDTSNGNVRTQGHRVWEAAGEARSLVELQDDSLMVIGWAQSDRQRKAFAHRMTQNGARICSGQWTR